jgi:hypothetical protein
MLYQQRIFLHGLYKVMSTKSAPNVQLLPRPERGINGVDRKKKTLPADLLPRKQQASAMPYLSAPRLLSKAEKWATDFYTRQKELQQSDTYHENLRQQLNLPERSLPIRPLDVRVVNIEELKNSREHGLNDGVDPASVLGGAYPGPGGGGGGRPVPKGKGPDHDMAQLNPYTKEISTTATQTMNQMVDAATSPSSSLPSSPTASAPPATGGDLALMSLDPPLQQVVNNYHNYQTLNAYMQRNEQHYHDNTQNVWQQVVQNTDARQQAVHLHDHTRNVLNHYDQQTIQNTNNQLLLHYNPWHQNNNLQLTQTPRQQLAAPPTHGHLRLHAPSPGQIAMNATDVGLNQIAGPSRQLTIEASPTLPTRIVEPDDNLQVGPLRPGRRSARVNPISPPSRPRRERGSRTITLPNPWATGGRWGDGAGPSR